MKVYFWLPDPKTQNIVSILTFVTMNKHLLEHYKPVVKKEACRGYYLDSDKRQTLLSQ